MTRPQGLRSVPTSTGIWDRETTMPTVHTIMTESLIVANRYAVQSTRVAFWHPNLDPQPLLQRHNFISPPLSSPARASPRRASVLYTRNQARQCAVRIAKASTKMMKPMVASRICQSGTPVLASLHEASWDFRKHSFAASFDAFSPVPCDECFGIASGSDVRFGRR